MTCRAGPVPAGHPTSLPGPAARGAISEHIAVGLLPASPRLSPLMHVLPVIFGVIPGTLARCAACDDGSLPCMLGIRGPAWCRGRGGELAAGRVPLPGVYL